jgi:hypothetical protein
VPSNDAPSAPHPTAAITINGLAVSEGDHICAFYRGSSELHDLVVPFLREGLHAGDKCICITGAAGRARLTAAVTDGVTVAPGQLEVEDFDATYLRTGSFTGEHMLQYWADWARRTFDAEGWPFARGATDMSWAQEMCSTPMLDDFLSYELQATVIARMYPQVALCLYDLDLFGGNVIIPVLKVHPKVLFRGTLLENPYYLAPPVGGGAA